MQKTILIFKTEYNTGDCYELRRITGVFQGFSVD